MDIGYININKYKYKYKYKYKLKVSNIIGSIRCFHHRRPGSYPG
jgi:hypothetical protein